MVIPKHAVSCRSHFGIYTAFGLADRITGLAPPVIIGLAEPVIIGLAEPVIIGLDPIILSQTQCKDSRVKHGNDSEFKVRQ